MHAQMVTFFTRPYPQPWLWHCTFAAVYRFESSFSLPLRLRSAPVASAQWTVCPAEVPFRIPALSTHRQPFATCRASELRSNLLRGYALVQDLLDLGDEDLHPLV